MQPDELVLFDLDHTLIRCDCFAGFLQQRLARSWWRLTLTLLLSPALVLGLGVGGLRRIALSTLVYLATVGLDEAALKAQLESYAKRRFSSVDLHCAPAIETLRGHLAAGARVIVVTGAAHLLAECICRELQLHGVEVVGSSLKRWRGGWVSEQHCYGAHKLVMLQAYGIASSWDYAYTDSAADIPLLTGAKRRLVVNPRAADVTRLSKALGSTFEIRRWG